MKTMRSSLNVANVTSQIQTDYLKMNLPVGYSISYPTDEEVRKPSGSLLTHELLFPLSFVLLQMKLCHKYTFFCIQVLAGALALGFDSAIATSLNMLPRTNIKILEAMRNSHLSEALQEQRKLSQAINVITRNGMYPRDS